MHLHRQALGIGRGIGRSNGFRAKLVELALAPFLRTLVAKHRKIVIVALRLSRLVEIVLDHGAHESGGAFRTEN